MASSSDSGPTPAQPGLIRSLNNRVVLDLLIERGSLSRSDVHTLTGRSKPTASQLLGRLEESGLVRQAGLGKVGPGGRAPQLYRIEPGSGHAAAIDVRPDRIQVLISDITGEVVGEHRAEITPDAGGPDATAAAVQECCAAAGIPAHELDSIVVGLPGSYDAAAGILHYVDHVVGWDDPAAGTRMRELFPGVTLTIENDVNLAAIAEQQSHGADSEDFFLLWLDEGVGGAIVINGALHRGSRGAAGESAFLYTPGAVVDAHTRTEGALEMQLGPSALIDLAASAGHEARTGADALETLLADPSARPALVELARRYAFALASVIALLDPARLVLDGAFARLGGERLRAVVAEQLAALVLTAPPLVLASSSESPILDGAMSMSLEIARDKVFTT